MLPSLPKNDLLLDVLQQPDEEPIARDAEEESEGTAKGGEHPGDVVEEDLRLGLHVERLVVVEEDHAVRWNTENCIYNNSFHFISFISRAKHRWNTLTQDISLQKCYPSCCENKLTLVRLKGQENIPGSASG